MCTYCTIAYGTKYIGTPRMCWLVRINGAAANQHVYTGARSKRREGGAGAQQYPPPAAMDGILAKIN